MKRSGLLRLTAMLMLTAWWPLATGNVAGCVLACRHAAAAMAHHGHQHGTFSHAAHHGPNIGQAGPCASIQPLALVATLAAAPAIADRLPTPEPPVEYAPHLPGFHTSAPELPPPRA